jgi:hypothetical protein
VTFDGELWKREYVSRKVKMAMRIITKEQEKIND